MESVRRLVLVSAADCDGMEATLRRRAAVDANQPAVVKELRQMGYSVMLTHQLGEGKPDFVVGAPYVALLVELKTDKKAQLTDDELAFRATWTGPLTTATTAEEIHGYMVRLRSFVRLPE
jgi:hypothetical protein